MFLFFNQQYNMFQTEFNINNSLIELFYLFYFVKIVRVITGLYRWCNLFILQSRAEQSNKIGYLFFTKKTNIFFPLAISHHFNFLLVCP